MNDTCGLSESIYPQYCGLFKYMPVMIYCDICNRKISFGERYIINDTGDYIHYDCAHEISIRKLLDWLHVDVNVMSDDVFIPDE